MLQKQKCINTRQRIRPTRLVIIRWSRTLEPLRGYIDCNCLVRSWPRFASIDCFNEVPRAYDQQCKFTSVAGPLFLKGEDLYRADSAILHNVRLRSNMILMMCVSMCGTRGPHPHSKSFLELCHITLTRASTTGTIWTLLTMGYPPLGATSWIGAPPAGVAILSLQSHRRLSTGLLNNTTASYADCSALGKVLFQSLMKRHCPKVYVEQARTLQAPDTLVLYYRDNIIDHGSQNESHLHSRRTESAKMYLIAWNIQSVYNRVVSIVNIP